MDKSSFIRGFIGDVALYLFYRLTMRDEEAFRERRQFENPLEKADDLCEVGYTFERNGIIYKKISQKKWLAEILTLGDDQFEIGTEHLQKKW